MSTLNIDKRTVSKTNRNGRIDINNAIEVSTAKASGGGVNYNFDNGIANSGGTVTFSGNYTGATTLTPVTGFTGNTLTINGDLFVDGNIKASKEVFAYFASGTSENVLNDLSVTIPIVKDTGNTISLNYSNQFEILNNALSIKSSVLSGSTGGGGDWNTLTNKPVLATVATSGSYSDLINKPTITSTISGATDKASYFTGTKALTASVADTANAVTWSNVSSKPTFATVATSGAYSSLSGLPTLFNGAYSSLSGIPSTFAPASHSIGSHSDSSSYFTGTKAYTAATADNSNALGGTAAANFYHSGNFNKSTVAIATSTLTAATSIVVNGWTISISAGSLVFNNGSNRCKVDASGNLTCSGEITAYGSV